MHLFISATKNNNLELAKDLYELAKTLKMPAKLICLEDFVLPIYTPSAEEGGIPPAALELVEIFNEASSLILCAPEYNGSTPPIVVNAIAWISRSGSDDWRGAFNEKPAIVATHSGGGGLKVTQTMRAQLEHLGAIVLPRPIITNFQKKLNPDSASAILKQLNKYCGLSKAH